MNEMTEMMGNETMEVTELLEMLYNQVADAWNVPLNKNKCMIPRESTLSLLEDIRAQLPVEISESRRLLNARDEFISNAKREAEAIRRSAEEEARLLVKEEQVVQAARAKANEIITAAENRAKELTRVANEYVDDAMRRTEEAISAALAEVHNSRTRFRSLSGTGNSYSTVDAQPIAPEGPEL